MAQQDPFSMINTARKEARQEVKAAAGAFAVDVGKIETEATKAMHASSAAAAEVAAIEADVRIWPDAKPQLRQEAIEKAERAIEDASVLAEKKTYLLEAKLWDAALPERTRASAEAEAVEREISLALDVPKDDLPQAFRGELVRAVKAGDDASWQALAGRYGQLLLRKLGPELAVTVHDQARQAIVVELAGREDLSYEQRSALRLLGRLKGQRGLSAVLVTTRALADMEIDLARTPDRLAAYKAQLADRQREAQARVKELEAKIAEAAERP